MNINNILESTQREVEKYRGHWPQLAYKAKVSYSWLVKVMEGKTENPRVTEMQRLITALQKLKKGRLKLN